MTAGESRISVTSWPIGTGPFQFSEKRFHVQRGKPGPVWVMALGSISSGRGVGEAGLASLAAARCRRLIIWSGVAGLGDGGAASMASFTASAAAPALGT